MSDSKKQNSTLITIKTTVEHGDKKLDSLIKIDAKDIVHLINNKGPIIANKAIQDIASNLYNTTNEKIKEVISEYL